MTITVEIASNFTYLAPTLKLNSRIQNRPRDLQSLPDSTLKN